MAKHLHMPSPHAGDLLARGADIIGITPDIAYRNLYVFPAMMAIAIAHTVDDSNIAAVNRVVGIVGGHEEQPEYSDVTTGGEVQMYSKTLLQNDGYGIKIYTKTTMPRTYDPPKPVLPEGVQQIRSFADFLRGTDLPVGVAAVDFFAGKVSLANLSVECLTPADKGRLDEIYGSMPVDGLRDGAAGSEARVLLSDGLILNVISENRWVE